MKIGGSKEDKTYYFVHKCSMVGIGGLKNRKGKLKNLNLGIDSTYIPYGSEKIDKSVVIPPLV